MPAGCRDIYCFEYSVKTVENDKASIYIGLTSIVSKIISNMDAAAFAGSICIMSTNSRVTAVVAVATLSAFCVACGFLLLAIPSAGDNGLTSRSFD